MRNNEVINLQKKLLVDSIGRLLSPGMNYAFLDFPNYANVGDSALWLGGLKLLSDASGRKPGYVCNPNNFNYDHLLKAVPNGPIFLSGGGNFGDIWPGFQDFREKILEVFKGRLIVQLPQSISFNKEEAIAKTEKIISKHGNFHLMVRDHKSLELSKKYFQCKIELVPDMAFALGPLRRSAPITWDVFMLIRNDSESAGYDQTPLKSIKKSHIADWLEEPPEFFQKTKKHAAINSLITGNWSAEKRRVLFYEKLAIGRLNRGLKMLSSGKQVITDRLHAHILSTLLDIPHVVLDNNYGKISSYINAWTHEYPHLKTANTAQEAIEKLAQLPKQ